MTTVTAILVLIGGVMYTVEDAVNASAILAEQDAGHGEHAERLACQTGLERLTDEEMEALCSAFGVER